jgi:hypothetical protein
LAPFLIARSLRRGPADRDWHPPIGSIVLIGGGLEDVQVHASHAPFVAACGGGPIVAFALEDLPGRAAGCRGRG